MGRQDALSLQMGGKRAGQYRLGHPRSAGVPAETRTLRTLRAARVPAPGRPMKIRRVPARLFPPVKETATRPRREIATSMPSRGGRPLFGRPLVEAAYRLARDIDPDRAGLGLREILAGLERRGHTFRSSDPYTAAYSAIVGGNGWFECGARGHYRWIPRPEDGTGS